jgi:hypothetical protein
VDEAGQATPPALLQALTLGAKGLVLVGDPMQLPPTVKSPLALAGGLEVSDLERMIKARMRVRTPRMRAGHREGWWSRRGTGRQVRSLVVRPLARATITHDLLLGGLTSAAHFPPPHWWRAALPAYGAAPLWAEDLFFCQLEVL